MNNYDFSRMAIIGCPGSGKTTLSNQLGKILDRQVVHLDKVLWKENWQEMPFEERLQVHTQLINQPEWVMDGMWFSHFEQRLQRATVVVFLDYSRFTCVWRVLKRVLKNMGKQRDDIAAGCVDNFDFSFLKHVWRFKKKIRPKITAHLQNNPQVPVITIASQKQLNEFLIYIQNNNKYC